MDRLGADEVPNRDHGPTLVLHPSGALTGMVVDEEGRPLAGVEVRTRFDSRKVGPFQFNPPFWQRSSGGLTRSRGDGRFRLGDLVPEVEYELRFQVDGYAPRTVVVQVEPGGTAPGELSVVLERGVTAVGEVLDRSGEPIPGATVTTTPARPPDVIERARRMEDPPAALDATTDGSGVFRFRDLPEGPLDLAVRAQGFAEVEVLGVRVERPVRGEVDLGTILLSPEARIRGRVLDPDGEPIPGVAVRIVRDIPVLALVQERLEAEPEAVTALDGWFEIGGLGSRARPDLRFDRRGFASESLGAVPTGGEPLTVVLEPTRVLAGRVVGQRGEPISDALVMVQKSRVIGMAAGQSAQVATPTALVDRTDEDGRFEIGDVIRGPTRLCVTADGWQEWCGRAGPTGSGEDDVLEIVLEPAAVVAGTVFGTDGQPVIGAEIREWAPELPAGTIAYRRPLATTDGDGFYRIDDLPLGRLHLEARHAVAGRAVRDVDAAPGEARVDFQLEGGLRASGQVLDPNGLPVAAARVALRSRLPSWTPPVTRTDGTGLFTFDGLSAGRYAVEAQATGVGRSMEPVVFEIDDQPVDDLIVELGSTGTVSGRILGLDQDELARVRLHAGPLLDVGRVDFGGGYAISGLSPGDWTITAVVAGTGRRATGRVHLGPDDPDAEIDLDFDSGIRLSGVIEVGGAPRAGLSVTLYDATGPVGWDQTGQDGGFSISGLSSGEYRIEVTSADREIREERRVRLEADRSVVIEATGGRPIQLER